MQKPNPSEENTCAHLPVTQLHLHSTDLIFGRGINNELEIKGRWYTRSCDCDYHLQWIVEETHRMVDGKLGRQTDATQHLNSLPSLSCRCWIQPLSGLLIDRISRLISYWQKREKLRVLTLNSGLNHGFRQQPVRLVVSSVRTSLNMGKNEITWKQIFTYWSQDSVSFIMELSTLNSALHWIIWEKGRLI